MNSDGGLVSLALVGFINPIKASSHVYHVPTTATTNGNLAVKESWVPRVSHNAKVDNSTKPKSFTVAVVNTTLHVNVAQSSQPGGKSSTTICQILSFKRITFF